MIYHHRLEKLIHPPPLLADYPEVCGALVLRAARPGPGDSSV